MKRATLLLLTMLTAPSLLLAADDGDVLRLLELQKIEIKMLEDKIDRLETRLDKLEQLGGTLNASKMSAATWNTYVAGGCACPH